MLTHSDWRVATRSDVHIQRRHQAGGGGGGGRLRGGGRVGGDSL